MLFARVVLSNLAEGSSEPLLALLRPPLGPLAESRSLLKGVKALPKTTLFSPFVPVSRVIY